MTLKDLLARWWRGQSTTRTYRRTLELEVLESRVVPAIPVSNSDDNGDDVNPIEGSLRQAINLANGTTGTDIIQFNIGGGEQEIKLKGKGLPAIVNPVIIDATAPAGRPTQTITLTRETAGVNRVLNGWSGLVFSSHFVNAGQANEEFHQSSGSEVKSLTVKGFGNYGIAIDGVNHIALQNVDVFANNIGVVITGQDAHHNSIVGSRIGKHDGNEDLRNKEYGVLINNGAHHNTIGAPGSGNINTITGNIAVGSAIVRKSRKSIIPSECS